MSEQSTSAKLRRSIVHRLPRFLQSRLTLSVAERAAVDLASSPAQFKVGSTSTTTFAIPLVGAHQVSDWDVINTALRISLQALIAQSDPNWRAVICSQTRPDAIDLDPRITFLPFEREVEGHDKVAKLQCLADYCLCDAPLPGFFMPLDGDDLLHRDLVARLGSDPQSGVLFDGGVILNSGTGELGRTRARSPSELGQKPFWKFCGSCMVLPVGRDFDKEHRFFHALSLHEHRLYPYLAKLAGIRLRRLAEPMAVYLINHGENFETRRGRGGFKQRFVKRFPVSKEETAALMDDGFPNLRELL